MQEAPAAELGEATEAGLAGGVAGCGGQRGRAGALDAVCRPPARSRSRGGGDRTCAAAWRSLGSGGDELGGEEAGNAGPRRILQRRRRAKQGGGTAAKPWQENKFREVAQREEGDRSKRGTGRGRRTRQGSRSSKLLLVASRTTTGGLGTTGTRRGREVRSWSSKRRLHGSL